MDDRPGMMTLQEYQSLALRTIGNCDLTVCALGLSGESGEVADHIKKVVGHGHDLDKAKVKKELGDVLWYVAAGAELIGETLEDVAKANIEKLKKRYPDGFDPERSKNRQPGDD